MFGDFNAGHIDLYTEKVAGNTTACIGFVVDEISGLYVPNTVLREDIRNNTSGYARIIATYRKHIGEETYSEITYKAKGVDLDSVGYPDEYQYLLDIE